MSAAVKPITVGITTRNRPAAILRCLCSLEALGERVSSIIVVDDSSDPPLNVPAGALPPGVARKLEVITQHGEPGNIVGRNAIMARATTDHVLLLDDDAYVLAPEPVFAAIDILDRHPDVGAIACAQAVADGAPWPAQMQPATAQFTCVVPAFIGFAHALRRDVFQALGGYREALHFYGEEKEFCLRLLQAGFRVVYVPGALVAHVPDLGNRSRQKHLRYVVRNDCLASLYNEPWPLAMASLPVRLARYRSMRRTGGYDDPGGLWWVVSSLTALLPDVLRARRAVTWATMRRWRRLRRAPEPFGDPQS